MYNISDEWLMNVGWQCPKCGTCWSPDIKSCSHCIPEYTSKNKYWDILPLTETLTTYSHNTLDD